MASNPRKKRFYPGVPGLDTILSDSWFTYYSGGGLNIVVYGPPGVGKTILSLQMAVSAVLRNQRKVIYLTKDTPSNVLVDRIAEEFQFFTG